MNPIKVGAGIDMTKDIEGRVGPLEWACLRRAHLPVAALKRSLQITMNRPDGVRRTLRWIRDWRSLDVRSQSIAPLYSSSSIRNTADAMCFQLPIFILITVLSVSKVDASGRDLDAGDSHLRRLPDGGTQDNASD